MHAARMCGTTGKPYTVQANVLRDPKLGSAPNTSMR